MIPPTQDTALENRLPIKESRTVFLNDVELKAGDNIYNIAYELGLTDVAAQQVRGTYIVQGRKNNDIAIFQAYQS